MRNYNIFRLREDGAVARWLATNIEASNTLDALLKGRRNSPELYPDETKFLVVPMSVTARDQIEGDVVVYHKNEEFIPWDFHQYESYKNAPMELVDLGD